VVDLNPYFENNVDDIYIAYYKFSHSFPSHFQNKIEIAHCFSGSQRVRLGDTIYTLKKGDSIFIAPNIIHEYTENKNEENEKTEVLCLMSDTDFFAHLLPELNLKLPKTPFIPSELTDDDTKLAFRKMTCSKNNNIELLGWACIALWGIVKNLKFSDAPTISTNLCQKLISYINENFKNDLNLDKTAAHFGYSTSYIAHIFSEQLKIPFRSYLASVRCEYAKKLIAGGGKNLTDICFECGFNSLNTFCRSFKKITGKTPSEYKSGIKEV
jgi:YesN/AraC family two-component response regulator